MLSVIAIDGCSPSRAPRHLGDIVEDLMNAEGIKPELWTHRASVLSSRALQARARVLQFDRQGNQLLAVGKSLGAKVLVERVMNRFQFLSYDRVAVVTIDPNWPLPLDWRPNLNGRWLELQCKVGLATNIYLVGSPHQQCGAHLSAPRALIARNLPVRSNAGTDHFTIVEHPRVRFALSCAIRFVAGGAR